MSMHVISLDGTVRPVKKRKKRKEYGGKCPPDTTRPFRCPESDCPWSFNRKYDLKRHSVTHLNEDGQNERMFCCPETGCSHSTLQYSNLATHYDAFHSGLKPLVCAECSYCTSDPESLKRHVIRQHEYIPEKKAPRKRRPSLPLPSPTDCARAASVSEDAVSVAPFEVGTMADDENKDAFPCPLPLRGPGYRYESTFDTGKLNVGTARARSSAPPPVFEVAVVQANGSFRVFRFRCDDDASPSASASRAPSHELPANNSNNPALSPSHRPSVQRAVSRFDFSRFDFATSNPLSTAPPLRHLALESRSVSSFLPEPDFHFNLAGGVRGSSYNTSTSHTSSSISTQHRLRPPVSLRGLLNPPNAVELRALMQTGRSPLTT